MKNLDTKNIDCHTALAMTKNGQTDVLQCGRSMIEMLGVLAIIGVLSVGGIAGYSKAMMKYRINKTIEQITLIAGNVRAFWGPQKNYIGVGCGSNSDGTCNASGCEGASVDADGKPTIANNGCPIVKKAKIFPDEMITVTDGKIMSITNPFGYRVALATEDKSKIGDKQAFYISYYIGDNEEACIELLTQDWSNANVEVIRVGSGPGTTYFLKTPVAVEKAIDICDKKISDAKRYGMISAGMPYINFLFNVDPNSNIWNNYLS